jgi:hypothetical protein
MLLVLLAACSPSRVEVMFERLIGTDFGGGVKFGLSPGQITPALGVPTVHSSKSAGAVFVDTYLPEGEKEALPDIPQLQLTYNKEQLIRIMNLERPFEVDPVQPPAPRKVTVVGGVGLGSRKSEFTDKLGEPNYGTLKDQWRFAGKDGRSVNIQAYFTENPDTKEPICSKLIIALSPKVAEQRGEQYEGKK